MATISTLVVKLVGETGPFVSAMEKAAKEAKSGAASIADALGGIGKMAAGAAVAGVGALTAGVAASINAMQDWSGTLDSLGDVLGTNADESAALSVAIKGVGGDVDGITGQMAKFVNGLTTAKGELGPTGEVMNRLGVAFHDANGQLLPSTTLLENIANRLSVMPDGLEKTAIMTDLFGKSGKDLSDTLGALANGGLAAAAQKAADFGLAIGDTGVNSAIEFSKSLEETKMMFQGLLVTIGNELLPVLNPLIQKFISFAREHMPEVRAAIENVVKWTQQNLIPLFEKLGPIIANPFEFAKNMIIQGILSIEAFFVDTINGVINGINNFTDELARATGLANTLYIEPLQRRQVSFGTNGGFAYGMGGAGEVTPGATTNLGGIVINLAPGQTEAQGQNAADAFMTRVRAHGLLVI